MDILTQILVAVGAITLIVVVSSFIGIMIPVLGDMIEEHRQSIERNKRRD